jgi:hypothetical protein
VTQSLAAPAASRPRLRLARFRDLALVPAIVLLVLVGALIDPVFLSQACRWSPPSAWRRRSRSGW